ncbi:arsenate reductase [Paraphysoderma sedebokerense]|nr:arsenate reductase [Paraphysoderma sedebokerense]
MSANSKANYTIYFNSSCSKSRAAHESLTAKFKNTDYNVINYLENPPTAEELLKLINMLGLNNNPAPLSRNSKPGEVRSVDEVLSEIVRDPQNLQRPIIVDWKNNRAVIARSPEKVDEILS